MDEKDTLCQVDAERCNLFLKSLGAEGFESIITGSSSAPSFHELSAGARKSETVSLRYPIMPVGDGIGG
jgi:hypothetical protein